MTSEADLDAAVRRVLGDVLAEGTPYTSIPLVDPSTKLPPAPTVDALRATLVDTGRLSEDELNGTIAVGAQPVRASFVSLGDSRTMLNGSQNFDVPSASGVIYTENRGYITQAMILLRHRLRWLRNGGVGGERVDQYLLRLDALLALNPGWLIGMGVINSINQGYSSASIIADLTTIFDKCAEKGVRVVWGTDWISGGTNTSDKVRAASDVNDWLRGQAQTRPGFWLAEYASILSDATTGTPPLALAQDGLHQDANGAYLMALELKKVLEPLVPPSDRLIASNVDRNSLQNGMMLGNVSGIATGWSKGTSGATLTKVARTDGIAGEWQQVVCTAETLTSLQCQRTLTDAGLVAGQEIFAEVEFETDAAGWNATEFMLQLQYIGGPAGGSSNPKVVNDNVTLATVPLAQPRLANGILRTPGLVIASGATHIQVSVRLKGSGTYRVSRARVATI